MRKALLLFALVFTVSLTAAFPASLNVVERTASPDDPAKFEVEVQNNFSTQQSFRISTRAGNLDWFYNDGPLTLQPGETGVINMSIDPSVDSFQHNWEFKLRVWRITTNDYEELSSYYRVERSAELDVVESEITKETLRPGENNTINVKVRNLGSEILDDYSFVLEYMNKTVERQGEALLPGTTERMPDNATYSFKLEVPKGASPGQVDTLLKVFFEGEEFEAYESSFEVEEVEDVRKNCSVTREVLKSGKSFYAENNGNIASEVEFEDEIPLYASPFVSYTENPDSETANQSRKTVKWSRTLQPGEEISISYTVNYRMPVLLVTAISLLIIAVWKIRRDVKIRKEAFTTEEGLKVRLTIKNVSGEEIDELKVSDFIPDIASVSRKFEMAHPDIHEVSEGTELEWIVEELNPGEERVLEYNIKPRVEVEGGLTLGPAKVEKDDEQVAVSSEASAEFRPK